MSKAIEDFNEDQRHVFDAIMHCVQRDGCASTEFPRVFFVDGPGSTGKTYLFNTLLKAVRSTDVGFALAVASSGTTALHLHGGRTLILCLKYLLKSAQLQCVESNLLLLKSSC